MDSIVRFGNQITDRHRYTDLLHTHYKSSVLDSLPEWLRNMDDKTSGSTDMGEFYDLLASPLSSPAPGSKGCRNMPDVQSRDLILTYRY